MNLFQRQYKIITLAEEVEGFLATEIKIGSVFEYIPASAVSHYIAKFYTDELAGYDRNTRCLMAMAYCVAQLPDNRSDVENLAFYVIKQVSYHYQQLAALVANVPQKSVSKNMI
ncbi:hypothetical protein [Shewanella waksmanii]|uniref:hypothetical protein n=1 Tax=Shewanella waksmanii TaxID=213783 RepID=UPI00048E7307|nr:hypothetical protein [Shewanella waksmanii]